MHEVVCHTIGHSNYPVDKFMNLLRSCDITCLVDIRSAPYSKYASQFNKAPLSEALTKEGFTYVYKGDALGGKCTNEEYLRADGTVDYNLLRLTPSFKDGIAAVIKNIKRGARIALMCAEKDPLTCHRFALVAKSLENEGVRVRHILEDGSVASNDALEEELLKKYNKAYVSGQGSLLDAVPSRAEAISVAYEYLAKSK